MEEGPVLKTMVAFYFDEDSGELCCNNLQRLGDNRHLEGVPTDACAMSGPHVYLLLSLSYRHLLPFLPRPMFPFFPIVLLSP